MPYSGCPHWTISRAALGYPILGEYDKTEKELLFKKANSSDKTGLLLAEVHPAVAMYIWLGKRFQKYKGSGLNKLEREACVQQNFKGIIDLLEKRSDFSFPTIEDDDQLDAFIAYLLGYLWIHKKDMVKLVGDEEKGSMLLPLNSKLISETEKMLQLQL